jgi:hypothetical protein
MSWTVVKFGKHAGKTIPQILFTDPDWFFWFMKQGTFRSRYLQEEADVLYDLATMPIR